MHSEEPRQPSRFRLPLTLPVLHPSLFTPAGANGWVAATNHLKSVFPLDLGVWFLSRYEERLHPPGLDC
jgi:hypothetical protein